MSHKIIGNMQVRDNSSQVTIEVDGNNANLVLGGNGHDGDIIMKNSAGKVTVGINGDSGAVHLGGDGQDGDLLVRDSGNQATMHLNGQTGNLFLGGNNKDGDLFVKDTSGSTTIHLDGAKGEIDIKGWKLSVPDYVFEEDYQLRGLDDLEAFVRGRKHLPGVPPQEEITRDGVNVGRFCMTLLEKVEELTLYLLEQNKTIVDLRQRVEQLEKS